MTDRITPSLITETVDEAKLHRAALRSVQHAADNGWTAKQKRDLLEAIGYLETVPANAQARDCWGHV